MTSHPQGRFYGLTRQQASQTLNTCEIMALLPKRCTLVRQDGLADPIPIDRETVHGWESLDVVAFRVL